MDGLETRFTMFLEGVVAWFGNCCGCVWSGEKLRIGADFLLFFFGETVLVDVVCCLESFGFLIFGLAVARIVTVDESIFLMKVILCYLAYSEL